MHTLLALEGAIIFMILAVIWTSVAHDHEGDWINNDTGERFTIAAGVARSAQRSIPLVRAYPWAPFRSGALRGVYSRAGRITWSDATTWRRYSVCATRHPLAWLNARDLVRTPSVEGIWVGRGNLLLDITKNGAGLRNGAAVEELTRSAANSKTIIFSNRLGEQFTFTWNAARATFEINNERIVMDRLDG